MRRTVALIPLVIVVAQPPLRAQASAAPPAVRVTPISDLQPHLLDGGATSPNGRFSVFSVYGHADSGYTRYDHVKKTWAFLGRDIGGFGTRWSPNGRFLAFVRLTEDARARQVWMVPMDTSTGLPSGVPRRVSTRNAVGFAPAWSPDGRTIAFAEQDTSGLSIIVAPFNGGDERVLFHAPGGGVSAVWSPDGKYIFADHARPKEPSHTLRITVADKHVDDLGEGKGWIIDISADGRWLAEYLWWRPVLTLRSTDGKQVREIAMDIAPQRTVPIAWSRTTPNEFTGRLQVIPTSLQQISIADGRIRDVTPIDSVGITTPAVSPDGKRIAYGRRASGTWQLILADTNGKNARVAGAGVAPKDIAWSLTGDRLMYGDAKEPAQVVDVATLRTRVVAPPSICQSISRECRVLRAWRADGQAIRYLERHRTDIRGVVRLHEVALDGRASLVTTAQLDGEPEFIARTDTLFLVAQPSALHLVNTRTGASRVLYKEGGTRTSGVAELSADGKWVATVADNYAVEPIEPTEVPLLISLGTGEAKRFPYSLGGEVSKVFFHPDGRNFMLIACPTCHGGAAYVEKWEMILVPMNGDPPRILTAPESNFRDFWATGLSPDGRHMYISAQHSYNTRLVTISLPKP